MGTGGMRRRLSILSAESVGEAYEKTMLTQHSQAIANPSECGSQDADAQQEQARPPDGALLERQGRWRGATKSG